MIVLQIKKVAMLGLTDRKRMKNLHSVKSPKHNNLFLIKIAFSMIAVKQF